MGCGLVFVRSEAPQSNWAEVGTELDKNGLMDSNELKNKMQIS